MYLQKVLLLFAYLLINCQVYAYNQTVTLHNNHTLCFQDYDKDTFLSSFLLGNQFLTTLANKLIFAPFTGLSRTSEPRYIKFNLDENHTQTYLASDPELANFQIPIFVLQSCSKSGSNCKSTAAQLAKIVDFYTEYSNTTEYVCNSNSNSSSPQVCNVFDEDKFKIFAKRNGMVYHLMNMHSKELIIKTSDINKSNGHNSESSNNHYCVFTKAIHAKHYEYHLNNDMPGKNTVPLRLSSEVSSSLGNLAASTFLNQITVSVMTTIALLGFFVSLSCCLVVKLWFNFGPTWEAITTYTTSYIPTVFLQLYLILFDVHLLNYVHYLTLNNFSILAMESLPLNIAFSKYSYFVVLFLKIFSNNFIEIFMSMVFAKGYGFWVIDLDLPNAVWNAFCGKANIMASYFILLNLVEFGLAVVNSGDKLRIYLNITKESVLLLFILDNYFNYTDFAKLGNSIEGWWLKRFTKKSEKLFKEHQTSLLAISKEKQPYELSRQIINEKLFDLNLNISINNTLVKYNKTIILLLVKLFFQVSFNFIELGFVEAYQDSLNCFRRAVGSSVSEWQPILSMFSFLDFFTSANDTVVFANRKFEEERIVFFIHCLKNGLNIFVNFVICLINVNFEEIAQKAKSFN